MAGPGLVEARRSEGALEDRLGLCVLAGLQIGVLEVVERVHGVERGGARVQLGDHVSYPLAAGEVNTTANTVRLTGVMI
jgi:hypothetical protein